MDDRGSEWIVQRRLRGIVCGDRRPQLILSSTDAISWTRHATRVDGLQGVTYGNGSFVAVGGYYSNHPRGVAVQSGGRPQMCLKGLGFGPAWNPGFHLLLTAEHGRSYRLQSSRAASVVDRR
jgi:hypothetical protein